MEKKAIEEEFTRQCAQMVSAPAFRASPVMERLVTAVATRPVGKLLDLACGPGIVAEAVAPWAAEVVGVDLTPEMIRRAEQRFAAAGLANGRFLVAPAEQLPFDDGTFDAVVTRLSLHHFPDVPAVFREIRRLLRSGGELIVADLLSSEDLEEADLHNALEQLRDPTHVRMLSRSALRREIVAAGFEVTFEDTWEQERGFAEWAQIVGDPSRTAPLLQVMKSLARCNRQAGIKLREVSGEVCFTHTWQLVKCRVGRA